MELAKRQRDPQFISRAASSLRKAQQISAGSLPLVSLLLAQAEASLGSKAKWERNLRLEWSSWPPGNIYFICNSPQNEKQKKLIIASFIFEAESDFVKRFLKADYWLKLACSLFMKDILGPKIKK